MDDTRLGTILLESRVIAEGDLEKCLQIQGLTGGQRPLGEILVEQALIDRPTLERLLELQDKRRQLRRLMVAAEPPADEPFLEAAAKLSANELVISEGRPPACRVAGEWRGLRDEALAGPEVWDFVRQEMGSEVLEDLAERRYVSRDFHRPGVCRGRITAFRQFDGVAVVVRLHPDAARTPADAGVPAAALEVVRAQRGLVLLVGERGGGLTEAFAALLHETACDPSRYVLVLDDNLEYPLPAGAALVVRRRVGEHVADYQTGLRTAAREDPDAVFVGDVSRPEAFDLALRAAEGGRLVVACLRAASVVQALQRALNFYQSYDVPRIRATLASVLQCVLVKHLLPAAQREGLVAATELLIVQEAVRDVLRQGDLANINLLMRMADSGSGHSLDRSLLALLQAGSVRFEDAFARAEEKAWLLAEAQVTKG
jgi:twitching motility protein PilT